MGTVAIALAIVFAAALLPFHGAAAKREVNAQTQSGAVYYFGIEESEYRFAEFANAEYQYLFLQHEFQTRIEDMYWGGDFGQIYDAYIVFDMSHGFTNTREGKDQPFPATLRDIFRTLKENGCKIMFLCGDDETLWSTQTYFLDYVDIHINIDILTVFWFSVFTEAWENSNCFENSVFFFDMTFSENYTDFLNGFFQRMILPTFFSFYDNIHIDSISEDGRRHLRDYMNYFNMRIYLQIDPGRYLDVFNDMEEIFLSDPYGEIDFSTTTHCYTVCTSSGMYRNSELLDKLTEYPDVADMTSVYMLRDNLPYLDRIDAKTVKYATQPDPDLNNYVFAIMQDFLNDGDLEQYNNWVGRCRVTFKAATFSENGWMGVLDPLKYLQIFDEDGNLRFGDVGNWAL